MFYAPIDEQTYEHLRDAEAWLDSAERKEGKDRRYALTAAAREMRSAEAYIDSGMTAAQRAEHLDQLEERLEKLAQA